MIVLIRSRDILQIAKGCLNHITKEEIKKLCCITLFSKHEKESTTKVFEKKRDTQRPNFHISFLLVLNNFFYVAFKYAERTEFGVHLIELLNNITFDGLKAVLSWFNKFQFEF